MSEVFHIKIKAKSCTVNSNIQKENTYLKSTQTTVAKNDIDSKKLYSYNGNFLNFILIKWFALAFN